MRIRSNFLGDLTATETVLRREMERLHVPGVTAAVLHGGEIVYQTALGVRDAEGRPMDENTLFESASLTKTLFGTLVMQLVQKGRFDLDKPIMDDLCDTPWSEDTRFAAITARQCLCHACGLPGWESRPMRMLFTPGERYSYSGEGYLLTQRLVEQNEGKDLNALLTDAFLHPLGMSISSATWTPEIGTRFSAGFGADGQVIKVRNARRTSGNAPEPCAAWSLYSNACQMSRFIQYVIRRHGGLDDAHFAAQCTPQIKAAPGILWGLGWGLCEADPTVLWHWGDNDGFKSLTLLDWQSGDALSVFTNSDNGFAYWETVARELTDGVFFDDLVEFVRHAED